MAGFSNYLESAIITQFVAGTKYVQLHTGDPGEDGTANVLSSASRGSVTMSAASNGVSTNTTGVDITYTGASVATVTHVSLWDAASGGNCLYTGSTTNRSLNQNDIYRFLASTGITVSNAD